MKTLRIFTLFFIVFFTFLSCEKKAEISEQKINNTVSIKLKKSELIIKGMTCEIGCAKLIQSKLAKTNGVKFVEVHFKDHIAMVEYDANKLNINKIKNIINGIAGGDLYSVTDNKEVTKFSLLKESEKK